MSSEEESAVSKLPPPLQADFFEMSERAAQKALERMMREREKMAGLRGKLRYRRIPRIGGVEDMRVGVVDGSYSPDLSEKMGYRVGVYTASYMVLDGRGIYSDDDDEAMTIGYVMAPQVGSSLHAKKILSLLATYAERVMAERCMKKYDVDLLILDGSFYGFRTRCSEVKKRGLDDFDGVWGPGSGGFKTAWDLINEVYERSRRLAENGRTIGVIKRLRTQAIDGWLFAQRWRIEDTMGKNDRLLLWATMRPGEYFDYRDILGEQYSYHHYSNIMTWMNDVRRWVREADESGEDRLRRVMRFIDRKLMTQIGTDLCQDKRVIGEEAWAECAARKVAEITGLRRIYIRPHDAAPFCVELGNGVDLETVVGYLSWSVNKATGLPFPLDLIDELISLDRRISREFAEEVEARILLKRALNMSEVREEFTPLNPQKE